MSERLNTIAICFLGLTAVELITGWILLLWLGKSVPESMNNLAFTVVGALGGVIGAPAAKHIAAAIGPGAHATTEPVAEPIEEEKT